MNTLTLLGIQALQAILLFIVPPLVVARIRSRQPLQWLHLSPDRNQKSEIRNSHALVWLSIGIMVCALPLINYLVMWNRSLTLPDSLHGLELIMQDWEHRAELLLQAFMTYGNGAWWVLCLNLIVLAILPAIGEELTFRGVLQAHLFKRLNAHVAVWLTAAVFSFIHFQFYGFIPRMLLGALLGYALLWSGNLRYSIIMHATNNAMAVLFFYIGTYACALTPDQIDALGTGATMWLTLITTPVMVLLIWLFYRYANQLKSIQ